MKKSIIARIIEDMPDDLEASGKTMLVICELRAKLEMRSLFLRASLALNTGLLAGLIVHLTTR